GMVRERTLRSLRLGVDYQRLGVDYQRPYPLLGLFHVPPRSRSPNDERLSPERSCWGLASLIVKARPCNSFPFKRVIACWASSGVVISTKPKPRDLPVNLSVIKFTEATVPTWLNRSSKSALVA